MNTIRPPRLVMTLLLGIILLSSPLAAQHLRRKCFLGIQPAPVGDSLARASGHARGVLLAAVLPGGTFEALQAKPRDILISLNGQPIADWPALRAKAFGLFEGDPVAAEVWRPGKKPKVLQLAGTVKGAAREQGNARYDVAYGEAPFEGGHLRTITITPKQHRSGAVVYFIPGYNCFSIDNMNAVHPYRKLFDSLATLGHVVYRVEKPGMGDGPSPCHCEETGFEKELAAFEAGYRHLLQQPWAPEDHVFIVGHSMGGIQAPLLTAKAGIRPRGIAVYGTVFQTWYEYILMMLRFQEPRSGEDYLAFEADMQEYIQLFYAHYVQYRPLSEIVAKPRWKALLERDFLLDAEGNILFRKAEYWQEIARHTLADAWAKTDAHVLSIFGEADFEVFDAFSMAEIARIVNHGHPGHGTFLQLDGTDHGMIEVGSMEQGLALRDTPGYRELMATKFNYRLVTEIHTWMERVLKAG